MVHTVLSSQHGTAEPHTEDRTLSRLGAGHALSAIREVVIAAKQEADHGSGDRCMSLHRSLHRRGPSSRASSRTLLAAKGSTVTGLLDRPGAPGPALEAFALA